MGVGAGHPAGAEERDMPAVVAVPGMAVGRLGARVPQPSFLCSDGAPSLDRGPVRTGPCRPALVLTVSPQLRPAGPEPTLQTSLTRERMNERMRDLVVRLPLALPAPRLSPNAPLGTLRLVTLGVWAGLSLPPPHRPC